MQTDEYVAPEKTALCRSLAPPCKGIPPPSVHPRVPECKEPPDESNTFFRQTAGEPPNVSPSSEREREREREREERGERQLVREDCDMWGENHTTLRHVKRNHRNGKWQMAPERHVLNFFPVRMFVVLLVEIIRAAPADV